MTDADPASDPPANGGPVPETARAAERAVEELSHAKAALNDAGSFAVAGAMLAGLGHAFSNRLVPILGYAQIFAQKFQDDPKLSRQAGILTGAVKELKRILERVCRIADSHPPGFRPEDLNEVIESALELVGPLLRERGVEVVRRLAENPPMAPIDRPMLVRGFLVLFYRAQQRFAESAASRVLQIETRAEADWAVAVVADNGPALSEEGLANALDRFNPLQRIGNEDCFNLGIPASVVEKHGGKLTVENNPAEGTRIEIRLPLQGKAAPTALSGEHTG